MAAKADVGKGLRARQSGLGVCTHERMCHAETGLN